MFDPFFKKPTTREQMRARMSAILTELEGRSIAELMRAGRADSRQHGAPGGSDDHRYDPTQPRVPAGHPDGGQWTSRGHGGHGLDDPRILSDVTPDNDWIPGADYAAVGHHYAPRATWKDLPLPPETRRVFEKAVSGPLPAKLWSRRQLRWLQHTYDDAHREYSAAVRELIDRHMRRRGIEPERMTPAQAEAIVRAIHQSSDLRIRRYNEMIKFLRRFYRMFGPRGVE